MTRDERIAKFREGLNAQFLPLYDALWAIAPLNFAPYFGIRTLNEQSNLYAKGRDESGKVVDQGLVVTHAKPGESAHNWGCAVDATIFDAFGNPEWLQSSDPRFLSYGEAVRKVGLGWGGDWSTFVDPGHAELPLQISWREVGNRYAVDGEALALRLIAESKLS